MSTGMNDGLHGVGAEELKGSWGWFVGMGLVLVVLGLFALSWSVFTTILSVEVFGWLLLFGGGMSVFHGFLRRRWGGFFLELFAGILYFVVGLMLLSDPVRSAVVLTLLIALSLLIGGIFRIVTALMVPFQHRVWMLLNGVISVLLGILIWRQLPEASFWVIGLFIAIDLIFYGWSLVMLGLTAKGLPDQPT